LKAIAGLVLNRKNLSNPEARGWDRGSFTSTIAKNLFDDKTLTVEKHSGWLILFEATSIMAC